MNPMIEPMNPNAPRNVPNYLVQAILVTIFCCLPFGIVAIIFAAQVNGKLAAGDYAGAVNCSGQAKMWSWIGFGIGLLGILAYFGLVAIGIAAGAHGQPGPHF
jgi:hypothetical protein